MNYQGRTAPTASIPAPPWRAEAGTESRRQQISCLSGFPICDFRNFYASRKEYWLPQGQLSPLPPPLKRTYLSGQPPQSCVWTRLRPCSVPYAVLDGFWRNFGFTICDSRHFRDHRHTTGSLLLRLSGSPLQRAFHADFLRWTGQGIKDCSAIPWRSPLPASWIAFKGGVESTEGRHWFYSYTSERTPSTDS